MSDAALEAKLGSLAEDVLTSDEIERLAPLLWSLDRLHDASELARAAAGTARA